MGGGGGGSYCVILYPLGVSFTLTQCEEGILKFLKNVSSNFLTAPNYYCSDYHFMVMNLISNFLAKLLLIEKSTKFEDAANKTWYDNFKNCTR
jgi:hypothetical protein